jgi:hypothetical protein
MNPVHAIPLAAFALLPVTALFILIRAHLLERKMGPCEQPCPRKISLQFFGVMLCTPVLIALNYVRDLDVLTRIAVCGVGVLGFYIALHDLVFSRINGIYRNGLVWHGTSVFFSDIDTVENLGPATFLVTLHDRSRVTIVASSDTQAAQIRLALEKTLNPLQ